mmetsp:Transcript_73222/g.148677  ORF Transcript_73222/g.148677 Transcript_73222/m.148677 type:complete len:925 (+) Transcript_73222:122-2896(+)
MSKITKDNLYNSEQDYQDISSEETQPEKGYEMSEGDTISDDFSSKSSDSNMTSNDGDSLPLLSSPGPRKVSLLATFITTIGAIAIGLTAGRHFSDGSLHFATFLAVEEAPHCVNEDQNETLTLSSASKLGKKSKVVFQYAEIADRDEDDEEGEEKDSVTHGDDSAEEEEGFDGVGDTLQILMNAYEVQDHFDDYDPKNGKAVITELLEDMLEASDECEDMFQLSGHFAHDATEQGGKTGTLQALGMFRYAMGHVSLTAWPTEKRLMADFLILSPRSTEKEEYDDDDEENEDRISKGQRMHACVNSIAKFLYPEDIIEPNGIVGDVANVAHVSLLGPFEAMSMQGKDPFRFRWWIDTMRGFKNLDVNEEDILSQMGSSDHWSASVTAVQSLFQRIDIIDSEDDYASGSWLKHFTDPELIESREYMEKHPHLFRADRLLFLDGVIQSTLQGLAAYHEALVQPAMFTHPNPKRVAIVGGGECATLRETLKHNTVETVVMVEIDPVIVEVSKEFLPEWNDCSMFQGSARYCMDDPRVEMYHLDALKWFRDRFSDEARIEGNELYGTEEKFDVVILDALDPQNAVDFVEALYGDGPFMNSLYNSLTDNGVLLTQVGEAVYKGDISEIYPGNFNYQRSRYEQGLKNQGFAVVMTYDEARAGFDGIWAFYAAFKDNSSRARWEMNEAQVDLEIRKRAIRMVDEDNIEEGEVRSPFDIFDGPTMATYRYPSKHAQAVFCLRDPKPYGCTTDINDHHREGIAYYEPTGFDPEIPNVSANNFSVDNTSGLTSSVKIPDNSYLMLEQSVHGVKVTPSTLSILRSDISSSEQGDIPGQTIGPVRKFVSSPKRRDTFSEYKVDTGLSSLLNHVCDGNYNTKSSNPSSGLATESAVTNDLVFNPSQRRNSALPEVLISSRTITEGEGISSDLSACNGF